MKVAALQMTRFSQRLTERIGRLALCALVSSLLVLPGLAAATPATLAADTRTEPASSESGLEATGIRATSLEDALTPSLRLAQLAAPPRYGFSSASPLTTSIRPERSRLRISGRRQRLGMTDEAEILAWSTGIGAVVGLASGLRQGENAVESTLKGAGLGLIIPIALGAMAASTFPGVAPAQPVRYPDLWADGPSAPRVLSPATPLLYLRISGQRARGPADRYVALGVGAGLHLSYVMER